MPLAVNYSELLRPVGQMLEALHIETFSLRVDDTGVAVQGQKPDEPRTPVAPQTVSLRVVWQSLRGKKTAPEPEEYPRPSSGMLELYYTHEDISRINDEAKLRRIGASGRPEAHALSQILRAVGGVVDQKQGRLISVGKQGQEITVEYVSTLKQAVCEKFTTPTLYDFWVRMYLRRSNRG